MRVVVSIDVELDVPDEDTASEWGREQILERFGAAVQADVGIARGTLLDSGRYLVVSTKATGSIYVKP